MAMQNWIAMRINLHEDPDVLKMAQQIDARPEWVVGCLHRVWGWLDGATANGQLQGITLEAIESLLQLPGFLKVMMEVGWLKYDESTQILRVPHWETWMSNSTKRRLRDALRRQRGRSEGDAGTVEDAETIEQVLASYRKHHPRCRPAAQERRLIRDRLAEGWTADELVLAIDGCHRSAYHCGENPHHRKYQSLELILRDAAHVQQFLEHASPGKKPLSREKIEQLRESARATLVGQMRRDGRADPTEEQISQYADRVIESRLAST